MRLSFLRTTNKDLAESDQGMGRSKISIQLQRMLTFSDALSGPPGQNMEIAQEHMAARMVRRQRQGLAQFCFGRGKGGRRVDHKGICSFPQVCDRRFEQRVDIVGVGRKGAIEKAARSRNMVWGRALVLPSQTLKIEVHR